jgi:sterol desaturase/sphingolipid hydroxylase (fatty acid hydroxylase superfamily)
MQSTEKKPGQIFTNPYLEALTKTSPWITFFAYVPIVCAFFYLSINYSSISIKNTLVLFFSGLFFWTFFEYVMHRYLFHFITEAKWTKRFHYMMHGVHHENPRDEQRVFMPPAPGYIIIAVISTITFFILQRFTFGFLSGWLSGYLMYCYVHYSIHALKPPRLFKRLWTHHTLHHYKYDNKAYGVSSPLWDYVFRTMPPQVESVRKDKISQPAEVHMDARMKML